MLGNRARPSSPTWLKGVKGSARISNRESQKVFGQVKGHAKSSALEQGAHQTPMGALQKRHIPKSRCRPIDQISGCIFSVGSKGDDSEPRWI